MAYQDTEKKKWIFWMDADIDYTNNIRDGIVDSDCSKKDSWNEYISYYC